MQQHRRPDDDRAPTPSGPAGLERRLPALPYSTSDLHAILDGSPDAIVVVNCERFITYANAAVEALTGYRPEEVREKPLATFLERGGDVAPLVEALHAEEPDAGNDLEIRHRDGSSLWVSLRVKPLRLADGSSGGAVAYLRDVTERRRHEQSLARKNGELEHYVDAVSHDLRSPLVSLLGFSRLLREDYAERLDDKGRHFLDRVEQAGRTMETLIHDLLELSRIGRSRSEPGLVDLQSVLAQLQAELKPRLEAQAVRLQLPSSLPLVRCDRTRLYQVFANLVGNALDHMGPREEARVAIHCRGVGGDQEIVVSDNGCGIAATDRDRIFEIFQSLGPRSCDGKRGSGMGLAIVKKIVETQGGRVWVESEPGHGAHFHVLLPGSVEA